jgi:hypothetical protein
VTDLAKVPDDVLLKLVEQRQSRALSSMSDDELLAALQSRQPQRQGVMATIDAGVRGAADMLTFGMADEIAAGLGSLFGGSYDENLKKERAIDAADEREHPIARTAGQVAGGVTGGVGAARSGLSLTNAAIARGMARPAQIGAAGVEGLVGGGTYGFGSGEGGFDQRVANMPGNAAVGAAGGAVGQAAAPLVQRGVTAGGDLIKRILGGTPAPRVSAEDLAAGMGAEFRRDASAGTKGLVDKDTGIPLTQGQASRDFTKIAKEEAMRNDALGEGAGKIMRTFDERQARAIEDAAAGIVEKPGRALTDASEIADRVKSAYGEAKAKTKAAYGDAALSDATTDASMFNKIGSAIKRELETAEQPFIIERKLHPATTQAIKYLDGLVPKVKDGVVVGVSAQKLESARKVLRSYMKSAANDGDKAAMQAIIRRYDDVWDTMAENGLFKGSDEAINALKVARQARREQSVKFEPQDKYDDAGKFIETVVRGNRSETEVANYLYGAAKVGEQGKAVRIVERLKTALGEDAPQIGQLQKGALDRVLYEPEGKLYGTQRMASRITDYLDGAGREYAKKLHTPEQIQALRAFRDAIEKTIPPKGATNPSGSAWAGSRIMQEASKRMMQAFGVASGGPLGFAVVGAADMGGKLVGRNAAKRATQGGFPIPKLQPAPLIQVPTAAGGVAAGVATKGLVTEDEKEPLRINVR